MRLFKYLLIDNKLLCDYFGVYLIYRVSTTKDKYKNEQREREVLTKYVNQFYRLRPIKDVPEISKEIDDLIFMSVPYPNVGHKQSAYILLNKEQFDTVLHEIVGPYTRDGNTITFPPSKKAGVNTGWHFQDKESAASAIEPDATRRMLEIGLGRAATDDEYEQSKDFYAVKLVPRLSGHVSHETRGKNRREKVLHESFFSPNQLYEGRCIHHIGHTFDNRNEYLKCLTLQQHQMTHEVSEPSHGIFRGDKVFTGEIYSSNQTCASMTQEPEAISAVSETIHEITDNKIVDAGKEKALEKFYPCTEKKCRECNGVLLLKTTDDLAEFITNLFSDEYDGLKMM